MASEDTEITLGTGKLLVLFFGLVAICALFFALGYSLGRKSEPAVTTASAAALPPTSTSTGKANSGSAGSTNPPMSFYKSVEQKDANAELTPNEKKEDSAPSNSSGTDVRPVPIPRQRPRVPDTLCRSQP